MQLKIGDWLRKYLDKTLSGNETTTMTNPPPIAKTIGFELIDIGQASATLKMQTDPAFTAILWGPFTVVCYAISPTLPSG